jgi:hypothetical protein
MGPGQGNGTTPMHPGGLPLPARNMMGPGEGNSTTPPGNYMQMFRSMAETPMIGSGMGVGMTDDFTVGSDGTAYIIRSVANAPSAAGTWPAWRFELDAISPVDGSTKWKLPISSGRVSSPVLASDGLIYLTVDNYQMFYANYTSGGAMMTTAQVQANDGQLLVISALDGSASIMRTIQTSSDVLSAPRIVPDPAGGYMVYVLGYDMMSWTATPASAIPTVAPGEKTLYAYRPDGSLKFSVKMP